MATVSTFVGYVESLSFNRSLLILNPDGSYLWRVRAEKRSVYYYDIMNDLFGVMLVIGERLTLKPHGEALSA